MVIGTNNCLQFFRTGFFCIFFLGFDIGGQKCVAAVTRKNATGVTGGNFIDISLDDASKRSVAPYICFPEKERKYGNTANKKYKSNIKSTIRRVTFFEKW